MKEEATIVVDKWKSKWLASMLEVFILKALEKHEMYGGQLVNLAQSQLDDEVKVPTVYAYLKKFVNKSILTEVSKTGEKSDITRGSPRKYYTLSDKGKTVLSEMMNHLNSWNTINFSANKGRSSDE